MAKFFSDTDRTEAIEILMTCARGGGFTFHDTALKLGFSPAGGGSSLATAAWLASNHAPSSGQDACAAELLRQGWNPPTNWEDHVAANKPNQACDGCVVRALVSSYHAPCVDKR